MSISPTYLPSGTRHPCSLVKSPRPDLGVLCAVPFVRVRERQGSSHPWKELIAEKHKHWPEAQKTWVWILNPPLPR